jgi:succinoglycan biosynthesis transport protein ExoP
MLMIPHEAGTPDLPTATPSSLSAHSPNSGSLLAANLVVCGGDVAEQAVERQPRCPEFTPALNFANLVTAVRHRWPTALAVGLILGCASALAVWFLLPVKYTAYALLQVASTEPQLLPENRAPLESDRLYQSTQVALIKSRPIILAALRKQPALRELGLLREQDDPAGWLEEELKAGILENTDILRISLTGKDPKELKIIVNAIKDAYLEQGVNTQRNQKLARLDELEKVYLVSDEKIRNQRTILRQLAENVKSSDPQALTLKQKIALDEYAASKRDLAQLQGKLRNAAATLAIERARPKALDEIAIPDGLVEEHLAVDPLVLEKVRELQKREDVIAQARKALVPGARGQVPTYEKERDACKEALQRVRAERGAAMARLLRQKIRDELARKTAQTQEQLNIWQEQEKLMRTEVTRLGQEAERIGTISFELELKRSEIEQAEAVLKRLREEKERLQVEVQSTKPRVIVLHEAEEPDRRDLKSQIRLTVFAGVCALLLGVFAISYWESHARRIHTSDQVAADLGMRVMGVLPALHYHPPLARVRSLKRQAAVRGSILVESIDGIRALLFCDRKIASNRVLMITSAGAREGKTTLASHLALSIARAGMRTLLVDCDLRRPALHQFFGTSPTPGISEVLRGETDTREAIQEVAACGLSILPAGQQAQQVIQALAQDGMRKVFEVLRRDYDFIIIDSCPVLPVADTLLLGKQVDSVLLSVRPHVSQVPSVFAAYERLQAASIPVLGVVLNGALKHLDAYQYDYLASQEADQSVA